MSGPTSRFYVSQRLRLHYVDWGNEGAPPLVLVHGGRDHCRSWDAVALALRERFHVLAPDLRGHGDSQWAPGSTYAVIDFVYDLAQLLHQKDLGPVTLVAHSLGGAVALQYAGIYPDRIRRLVAIEGLGPSPRMIAERAKREAPDRMAEWIENVRDFAGRLPRRYPDLEEAVARMRDANPNLDAEQARHLTVHGILRNEDGTYSWKFDNYVRIFSPYGFNVRDAHAHWRRITCPTLLVRGQDSWASDPEKDGRAAVFPRARVVNVPGAGHWVHHDQLAVFLRELEVFLAEG